MKVFTQRIMLLAMLITTQATTLFAQAGNYVKPRLIVNGSAAISGPKQFNWSQNPAVAAPWGRPIDTVYYNVPVAKAYDELGEKLLLNGTGTYPSLAGKFALILRGGGISFSQKADYCQRAGAIGVIIVNHKNGGTIGMAPTLPYSTNTTIPVLIISREDGFPINDALKAGQPVTISLSNWGFKFPNDIGIVSYSPATPHAFCVPLTQINAAAGSTPRAYNFYTGAYVANFGTATQSNVKLRQVLSFTPTGGAASVIYADSVVSSSFPLADSVQEFFSPRTTKQIFSSTGVVNMTYTASSTATDQNPTDNISNYQMFITDSIFCKSRWNLERNAPLVSSSVRYSASQPLVWGPLFYVTKGGYRAVKAQLAISADSDLLNNNIVPPSVLVYLYKWKDANNDGLVNGNELSIVANGYKSVFTNTDSSGKPFTVDLNNSKNSKLIPRVLDSSWYFLAAELEHDFGVGADNETNFYTRSLMSHHFDSSASSFTEYWAPNFTANLKSPNYLVTDDTLSNISFFSKSITQAGQVAFTTQTGLVPSMALHLSKIVPTSVESNLGPVFNKLQISPNPATTALNINVDLVNQSNMIVNVVNAAGQSILYSPRPSFKSGIVTVNTSSYPAGVYYLVIGTDYGTESRAFTVIHQ